MNTTTMDLNKLEMLTQREQLMEDIDTLVEDWYYSVIDPDGWNEAEKDDLIHVLCEAVCRNFPVENHV